MFSCNHLVAVTVYLDPYTKEGVITYSSIYYRQGAKCTCSQRSMAEIQCSQRSKPRNQCSQQQSNYSKQLVKAVATSGEVTSPHFFGPVKPITSVHPNLRTRPFAQGGRVWTLQLSPGQKVDLTIQNR